MQKKETGIGKASRRRALQALAGLGVIGPAASMVAAQAESPKISVEMLRSAASVDGKTYTEDRLGIIDAALQRNLDQFQLVRDFQVDDSVEPAPMFLTKRYEMSSRSATQKRKGA